MPFCEPHLSHLILMSPGGMLKNLMEVNETIWLHNLQYVSQRTGQAFYVSGSFFPAIPDRIQF